MLPATTQKIVSVIATVLLMIFILGLSRSISGGLAGFWGGLPFMVIAIFILALAIIQCWQEAFRKKD